MRLSKPAVLFRVLTLLVASVVTLVGLWALIVGAMPFALAFGLMTFAFAEAAAWQHRRLQRRVGLTSGGPMRG